MRKRYLIEQNRVYDAVKSILESRKQTPPFELAFEYVPRIGVRVYELRPDEIMPVKILTIDDQTVTSADGLFYVGADQLAAGLKAIKNGAKTVTIGNNEIRRIANFVEIYDTDSGLYTTIRIDALEEAIDEYRTINIIK